MSAGSWKPDTTPHTTCLVSTTWKVGYLLWLMTWNFCHRSRLPNVGSGTRWRQGFFSSGCTGGALMGGGAVRALATIISCSRARFNSHLRSQTEQYSCSYVCLRLCEAALPVQTTFYHVNVIRPPQQSIFCCFSNSDRCVSSYTSSQISKLSSHRHQSGSTIEV